MRRGFILSPARPPAKAGDESVRGILSDLDCLAALRLGRGWEARFSLWQL